MFESAQKLIDNAHKITVIQAENPDGDSLASSLALEEILGDQNKEVLLYCPVEIPKYMRYITGWDRVTQDFDTSSDLAIIVDTTADVLISKLYEEPGARHYLETHDVLVIDHHITEPTLVFDHTLLTQDVVATSHVIYNLSMVAGWPINAQAAEDMLIALMSDSLGLTTPNVTPETYHFAGKLAALGASNTEIENRRREFMKKSPDILAYKGKLIEQIEYYLDGALAVVRVPWEDIQAYSDKYNPGALIGDELRLVENVALSVVIKTYPDGKVTGRLRGNLPIAEQVAGFFGGGGHAYAAGFRVYDEYDTILRELIQASDKALKDHETTQHSD